jgi:hypothetical protein
MKQEILEFWKKTEKRYMGRRDTLLKYLATVLRFFLNRPVLCAILLIGAQVGFIWYWSDEIVMVIPVSVDMSVNLSEEKNFSFSIENLGRESLDLNYDVDGIPNWIRIGLPTETTLKPGNKEYITANVSVSGGPPGQYQGEILVKKMVDDKVLTQLQLMLTVNSPTCISQSKFTPLHCKRKSPANT